MDLRYPFICCLMVSTFLDQVVNIIVSLCFILCKQTNLIEKKYGDSLQCFAVQG